MEAGKEKPIPQSAKSQFCTIIMPENKRLVGVKKVSSS
jgi:hypothetical protein